MNTYSPYYIGRSELSAICVQENFGITKCSQMFLFFQFESSIDGINAVALWRKSKIQPEKNENESV